MLFLVGWPHRAEELHLLTMYLIPSKKKKKNYFSFVFLARTNKRLADYNLSLLGFEILQKPLELFQHMQNVVCLVFLYCYWVFENTSWLTWGLQDGEQSTYVILAQILMFGVIHWKKLDFQTLIGNLGRAQWIILFVIFKWSLLMSNWYLVLLMSI